MNILTAYQKGLQQSNRQWRMILVLFLVHFVLAAMIAWPLKGIMESAIGDSLALNSLLKDYDHTVLFDMIGTHGSRIFGIIGKLGWILLAYLLLTAFLRGGMLSCFETPQFRFWTFWEGGSIYFTRFLRILLWVVSLQVLIISIVTLVIILVATGLTGPGFTDRGVVWFIQAMLIPLLFGITLVSTLSQYAHIVTYRRKEYNSLQTLRLALKVVKSHLRKTYGLFLMNASIMLVLWALYQVTDSLIGMQTGLSIWIMLWIQQAFVCLRLWARMVNWASSLQMYDSINGS